ncbi:hypothetical protein [Stigmatella erecta]|uniref:Uncharacterized protein n=1 Tax=Stigmatella erecta TaxID=83460 RepID=A0A1I0JYE7_9BACT|nr:hypothetical protein [Stigmatella erecta]SEU15223.1 hypothetical protein SAMN05443639_108188 [Stigmatella erecta]
MKRGLLLALLTATAALAKEPQRAQAPRGEPSGQNVPRSATLAPVAEPAYFDLVASDDKGQRVGTYRFYRDTRKVARLRTGREIENTAAFSRITHPGDYVIAVAPEKKPKPNPPNPGDEARGSWKVPQAELQEALKQVQAEVPASKSFLVGQFASDVPRAR